MKTPLKRVLFFIALLVLAASQVQAAIDPATVQKLLADDGAEMSWFGWSVSLSADGSIALIGTESSKSAYVFTRATDGYWIQQAKLTTEDDRSYYVSLSADGNTALIGAYVFTRVADGSWSQQAKLRSQQAKLIVGALSADGSIALIGTESSKSAYVFTRAADGSWSQQDKLTAEDGATSNYFGRSVSLSADGGSALIGDQNDDDNGSNSGSAYVFTRAADGSWSQQDKLTAEDGTMADHFGNSVSLSADGSIALIGAYYDDDKGEYFGSAYVFTRAADGSWSQQDKLTAEDGTMADSFGNSVALSADGGTALIGARPSGHGVTYVFTRAADGGWSKQAKLTADARMDDFFGEALSLSADGSIALIGSAVEYIEIGSAYVFTRAADGIWGTTRPVCGDGRYIPANTWLMTAPSCQPANPPGISIAAQYGDDLSPAYATDWIGWKWDASAQAYPPEMAAADPLVLGDGNWVYSYNAGNLTLSGTATPTEPCSNYGTGLRGNCFAIDLTPSGTDIWQIVGNPFPYPVTWADMRVASYNGSAWTQYTPLNAALASLTKKELWRYNGNAYATYDDSTWGMIGTLRSQESFWVRILSGSAGLSQLKLLIPAR